MKYLLDTMVWLWSVGPSRTIGAAGLGGNRPARPRLHRKRLVEQGIRSLPINLNHSLLVYDLPSHHADPFDRMIIAQAMVEGMTVLTSDRAFEKYPIDVVWCGK